MLSGFRVPPVEKRTGERQVFPLLALTGDFIAIWCWWTASPGHVPSLCKYPNSTGWGPRFWPGRTVETMHLTPALDVTNKWNGHLVGTWERLINHHNHDKWWHLPYINQSAMLGNPHTKLTGAHTYTDAFPYKIPFLRIFWIVYSMVKTEAL